MSVILMPNQDGVALEEREIRILAAILTSYEYSSSIHYLYEYLSSDGYTELAIDIALLSLVKKNMLDEIKGINREYALTSKAKKWLIINEDKLDGLCQDRVKERVDRGDPYL